MLNDVIPNYIPEFLLKFWLSVYEHSIFCFFTSIDVLAVDLFYLLGHHECMSMMYTITS
jgi:hypothetical protein